MNPHATAQPALVFLANAQTCKLRRACPSPLKKKKDKKERKKSGASPGHMSSAPGLEFHSYDGGEELSFFAEASLLPAPELEIPPSPAWVSLPQDPTPARRALDIINGLLTRLRAFRILNSPALTELPSSFAELEGVLGQDTYMLLRAAASDADLLELSVWNTPRESVAATTVKDILVARHGEFHGALAYYLGKHECSASRTLINNVTERVEARGDVQAMSESQSSSGEERDNNNPRRSPNKQPEKTKKGQQNKNSNKNSNSNKKKKNNKKKKKNQAKQTKRAKSRDVEEEEQQDEEEEAAVQDHGLRRSHRKKPNRSVAVKGKIVNTRTWKGADFRDVWRSAEKEFPKIKAAAEECENGLLVRVPVPNIAALMRTGILAVPDELNSCMSLTEAEVIVTVRKAAMVANLILWWQVVTRAVKMDNLMEELKVAFDAAPADNARMSVKDHYIQLWLERGTAKSVKYSQARQYARLGAFLKLNPNFIYQTQLTSLAAWVEHNVEYEENKKVIDVVLSYCTISSVFGRHFRERLNLHVDGYVVFPGGVAVEDEDIEQYKEHVSRNGEVIFNRDNDGGNDHMRKQADITTVAGTEGLQGKLKKFTADNYIDRFNLDKAHSMVLLYSEEGCEKQQPHTDYSKENMENVADEKVPLGCLVALEDQTFLDVWPKAIRFKRIPYFPVRLELKKGDVFVFRGDLVHAGSSYKDRDNVRVHIYLDEADRPRPDGNEQTHFMTPDYAPNIQPRKYTSFSIFFFFHSFSFSQRLICSDAAIGRSESSWAPARCLLVCRRCDGHEQIVLGKCELGELAGATPSYATSHIRHENTARCDDGVTVRLSYKSPTWS